MSFCLPGKGPNSQTAGWATKQEAFTPVPTLADTAVTSLDKESVLGLCLAGVW